MSLRIRVLAGRTCTGQPWLMRCPFWLLTAQKAEEEAAKVYEEFVESFQANEPQHNRYGPRDDGPKPFVRGGVVMPGSKPHEGGLQRVWSQVQGIGPCSICAVASAGSLSSASSAPQAAGH